MHRVFQGESCFDRVSGRRSRTITLDVTDETKPTLTQRANKTLTVAAVAERAPGGADTGTQRRLRDDASLPNCLEEFVLAHDSIAVPNEVNEEVEYLRLDVNGRAGAPHLLSCDVNLEIGEAEVQACCSRPPHHVAPRTSIPANAIAISPIANIAPTMAFALSHRLNVCWSSGDSFPRDGGALSLSQAAEPVSGWVSIEREGAA